MIKVTTSSATSAPSTNFCQSVLCRNGGTCISQQNGYSCSCPNGVYGTSCEFGRNNFFHFFNSKTPKIIKIYKNKIKVLKNSTVTNAPSTNYCQTALCRNGGTCINQQNGYSCSCPSGVYGSSCEFSNYNF